MCAQLGALRSGHLQIRQSASSLMTKRESVSLLLMAAVGEQLSVGTIRLRPDQGAPLLGRRQLRAARLRYRRVNWIEHQLERSAKAAGRLSPSGKQSTEIEVRSERDACAWNSTRSTSAQRNLGAFQLARTRGAPCPR